MQFQTLSIILWSLTATNISGIHAAFTSGGIPAKSISAKGSSNLASLPLFLGENIKSNTLFVNPTTSSVSSSSNSRLFAENSGEAESTQEPTEASDDKSKDKAKDEEKASPVAKADVNDILNSPAFLKRKIDVLKSDIKAANEKIEAANKVYEANKAEWGPDLEKLSKEYANISERLENENKAGKVTAIKEVAIKLLKVMDNYDRAFQQVVPETDGEKAIEESYKNVYKMIVSALGELGVKEIETVGKEFDYELHQAVIMRPDEDYEEGVVCEELAKGWAMQDGEDMELIRAAMVVVAQ